MKGRRLQTVNEFFSDQRRPGDYCKASDNHPAGVIWYICDPADHVGRLVNHTVTEHEDGTITVSPSILNPAPGGWHGYLEHGEWRSV
jgi:hypothetical protein